MSRADRLRKEREYVRPTVAMMKRRELMKLAAAPVRLSDPSTPPHWACQSCGMPCYCVDPLARLAPHVACDKPEVIVA